MNIIEQKWDEILHHIVTEHELSDVSFRTWLEPLSFEKVENNTLYIKSPHPESATNYVKKKYTLPIKVAVAEITGLDLQIRFLLSDEEEDEENDVSSDRTSQISSAAGLNPKYTFDTFVVGSNNKFAHAAALAVAESPGEIYNPLFLYGGVGLGKTHLMNSIAHFILEKNPSKNILYVTSEEFTNEVIEAIRNGNNSALSKFREKYRNIDVLLVDDVQFIIGKESTQEEFFHTFNALHSARKQIILSSDRPPKDMDILEERIKSRFEWGLMADIQSPDYETRMAILRKKEEMDGYSVSNDVIEYIAQNVRSNIRELEGSLNKVIALANLEHRNIDIELAKTALCDIISPDEKKVITPDYIIRTVAEHYNITPENICSDNRSRRLAYPRQIVMYLIREMTKTNLQEIGSILGGKNHTTVMYGINKIEKDYQSNPDIRTEIDFLIKKINPSV